jgi:adenylate cyclase, class 2
MTTDNQMEIEAKIAVEDLAAMESLLARLGARKKGEYLETDAFFDDEPCRLKNTDSALRLRDRQNLNTGDHNYRLTFKGPRQAGPFKHRREIEFAVDRPESVAALLEALGFHAFARYTKRRNSWSFGRCTVEVDEIEAIGKFVEVEGPDEDCIRGVLGQLNLADHPVIHESYLAMVMKNKEKSSGSPVGEP